MNVIVPCSIQEAAALFVSPQWVSRIIACTTHDVVMTVFRLFLSFVGQNRINALPIR